MFTAILLFVLFATCTVINKFIKLTYASILQNMYQVRYLIYKRYSLTWPPPFCKHIVSICKDLASVYLFTSVVWNSAVSTKSALVFMPETNTCTWKSILNRETEYVFNDQWKKYVYRITVCSTTVWILNVLKYTKEQCTRSSIPWKKNPRLAPFLSKTYMPTLLRTWYVIMLRDHLLKTSVPLYLTETYFLSYLLLLKQSWSSQIKLW